MSADYELLTVETVAAHVAARPALVERLDAGRITSVREVGDGNLNLVFILRDSDGRSLVLKQALPYVRVDPTWPMTPERARHEADALAAHGAVDPAHVPALFDFDASRYVLGMEDLSDHVVWRGALNRGERHDGAAGDIGTLVARTAFATSALGLDPFALKAALARSVSPALCQITEDLVFTEPYITHEHNVVLGENEPDVAALAGDPDVLREVGLAKWAFMTHAEALLHGDLHTGSVMVRAASGGVERSTKAFDSEFGFYGPVGFDLGALWANLVLAAARGVALGDDDHAAWCLAQPALLWDAFESELRALWPSRVDPRVWGDAVLEDLVRTWRSDAAVFAGAKVARRIIGFAKVSDVETLPADVRVGAARGALRAARLLMVERHTTHDVDALTSRAGDLLLAARTS
jgi:5-methylthioribose kinase